MRLRPLASSAALWLAVCALVLRAGMPLLAVAAAQRIGVPVAEVCEVYGVLLPSMAAQPMAGHAHHHPGHPHQHSHSDSDSGCDHCALTALGTLGAPSSTLQPAGVQSAAAAADPPITIGCPLHDAHAAWAARLGHGPPVRA